MKLVVVESPSKAQTLGQYLGKGYRVLASVGHVRDLQAKTGSVDPENDFALTWQVIDKAAKPLQEITKAVAESDTLILATDPDREGEAISWHLLEYLKQKKNVPKDLKVERITFHSITKDSVLQALKNPRQIHQELVDAYLARLSLDYLVGFTLSPVLWRKLPGCRSAGRVQSVALRLVVEREEEIRAFRAQEYWTVEALFKEDEKAKQKQKEKEKEGGPAEEGAFAARLTHFQGEKLDKFALASGERSQDVCRVIENDPTFYVSSVTTKRVKRSPAPPFTTSSLQQEASRKLGFSPSRTMRVAQRLYEGVRVGGESVGLITYMRTDSVSVEPSAIMECRSFIEAKWGEKYLPSSPRMYKTKARNAQEAHEAIRPTDLRRVPESLLGVLEDDQRKLYQLIWDRTAASQMADAQYDQTAVDIVNKSACATFHATGSVLVFDGFMKLYQESFDDADKEKNQLLPALKAQSPLAMLSLTPEQHFTQPPARYSEASLVKKMEELGIGRPSTYAGILQILQDRNYVRSENKRLVPEEKGRLVIAFLKHYFARYVDFDFTASMEEELDDVSSGKKAWKNVMRAFWDPFSKTIHDAHEFSIQDVLEAIEPVMLKGMDEKERKCPQCSQGELHLRLGRFGPFLACSRYPECTFTLPLGAMSEKGQPDGEDASLSPLREKELGTDDDGDSVRVKKGPYGWYIEWGEGKKRTPVQPPLSPERVTLEQAKSLKELPRVIGVHPETQLPITIGIGRFGPWAKYEDRFFSIRKAEDWLHISLEEAMEIIEKMKNRPPRPSRGKRPLSSKSSKSPKSSKSSKPKTSKRQSASKEGAKTRKIPAGRKKKSALE